MRAPCSRCGSELGELEREAGGYARPCLNSECTHRELETEAEWRARLDAELDELLERIRRQTAELDAIGARVAKLRGPV